MKRFTPIWFFVLISLAGAVYLPGLSKYWKFKRKEIELKREIERLQIQITQLQKEELLLKTDLTRFEEVVREELRLVKPGEVVYRVVEEEIPVSTKKNT